MKKSRGIITLLVALLLIAGFGYIALFGLDGRGSVKNIKQGLDLAGGVSITYQVKGEEKPSAEDLSDTVYKLQKRVDSYSTEAQVYSQGGNRINVEIPGEYDAEAVLTELGKPGSLYFIMQYDGEGNLNYGQIPLADEEGNLLGYYWQVADQVSADSIILEGTDVKNAEAGYTQDSLGNKQVCVSLTLTDAGTAKFAEATAVAYAKNWSIAIVYDGQVISAPSVNAVITDGSAQITGMQDFDAAERLATSIRIGGLKLELEELSSNVVGAQLGTKAIETSIKAGIIGLIIVIIFMIAVYRIPGIASGLALVIYTILTMLCLNFFNVTLTLPGIAGIILSIGMAVDANVIIFARIREEIATGKTVRSSIDIGFKKALSAIVDGNITTLIAAIVLMIKGSGSVKGFAQTLAIGIILSMFTAIVITRFLLKALYAVGCKSEGLYGKAKDRKTVNFLSKKAIFFAVSILAVVSGFVAMGIHKGAGNKSLNFSLEFSGGTSFNAVLDKDYSIEELEKTLKVEIGEIVGDNNIQISKVKDSNEVSIKTKTIENEVRGQIVTLLQENYGVTEEVEYTNISATISNEMRRDAIVAVIIATILMLLYIWFRFKDIRFAGSAVLALVHDVLVVLAFYAISRTSVGNTFIACMLTIVGYSINATIVIFDRIRENLKNAGKKADVAEIVNKSITQTLTRSIYTSITTFVMVFVLYIMGVAAIQTFALPLIVGIVCGAYSSVCITGALWYVMRTKLGKKNA